MPVRGGDLRDQNDRQSRAQGRQRCVRVALSRALSPSVRTPPRSAKRRMLPAKFQDGFVIYHDSKALNSQYKYANLQLEHLKSL
jgi:hypothetical protein